MAKNSGRKFFEGALLGAAFGAASGIVLGVINSKKIKKGAAKSKKHAAEFYKQAVPQLKKLKRVGEGEYDEFMKKAIANYARVKKLSGREAMELAREAKKYWQEIKKHI
ncbi:MAG: hypothetical protein HYT12_04055 [Candidatus Liptonbacteria bacterium]|nr:hypothetical protein [Candidatus Liptonbacteria bacterium]